MNRTGSEKDFPDLWVDHPRKLGWVKPSVWKVLFSGPSTVYTIPVSVAVSGEDAEDDVDAVKVVVVVIVDALESDFVVAVVVSIAVFVTLGVVELVDGTLEV